MKRLLLPAAILVAAQPALAQGPAAPPAPANPAVAYAAQVYGTAKGFVLASAEQVPEEHYAFKPTPEVRSFGQIIGHVANAHYLFCSAAAGEKSPATADYEKTAAKADLIAALRASIAYCDKVYAATADGSLTEQVTLPFGTVSKGFALNLNGAHDFEHYGNLVTYMRIKGMVPPSSQQPPRM